MKVKVFRLLFALLLCAIPAATADDQNQIGFGNEVCARMCEWGYENCVCANLGVCGDADEWDTDILKTTSGARCFDSYVFCIRGCEPYTI